MREYILVMLAGAATTYLLSGLARAVAIKLGIEAQVRERDVHSRPTPYLGGVAMLAGVAVAFLLASIMPFLGRHEVVTRDSLGIFAAAALVCAVGVVDDAIELPAVAKAAGQVLAAGIAVLNGVRMYWISLPDRIIALDQPTSIIITVVFIFICVNAINFVDGLDGLAAGVVAIGSAAMFTYTYVLAREQNFVVATTASLVTSTTTGVCLGFLPHNFHRARMFMGDSGSMLLGLLLACSSLSFTGQIDSRALSESGTGVLPSWLPLVLPFAIMALPLFDLVAAYVRRTWNGKWWFVADKQHLHHRLLQRGHSVVGAVLVMYLWTAVIGFGVVLIGLLRSWWVVVAFVAAVVTLIVTTARVAPAPREPATPRVPADVADK
ncbi:MraY family glycosyltransferase [Brooklawnia cerclae]|uniref:UDP-GlcNAc:undecaprenyl-phosphate GlcNAc-1-phosphate transferase n=1 Tax=Brooklawnia cerclae TaxID=349934 RepID=A0ABX0SDF9_9ACTN|nr:MraY family glycosyltransferase [Brooklawnia cerclae]NIH56428.1 UDP-GlcNAc:undecaprenyl-phosphate GlcNAc-1-phosphate transferase [Brooklawnia cerclae]